MEIKPVEKIGNYKIHYDNEYGLAISPIDYKTLKMTAKEMFEKLGFVRIEGKDDYGHCIEYYSVEDDYVKVAFYLSDKKIGIGDYILLSVDLFKAINKQIEELGWNNE